MKGESLRSQLTELLRYLEALNIVLGFDFVVIVKLGLEPMNLGK